LRYTHSVLLATAAVALAITLSQPARADLSFDVAYSNLSDHGSWLVSAQFGHVWQPREYNRQWSPYYDGHWVYTDMGWAWVSDYQWGAIPYHYGTWVNDPYVGWVWIPGRVWAPAWVVFRTTPDYIGWAPVPPGFSVGMSIDMGGPGGFIFVSSHDFLAPRLRSAIIPVERTSVFINNTTIVNNITIQNNVVINRGPDYRTVEKATGRTIRPESIESVARVAPYEHVSRAQLAVDPGTDKRGVRVAEPVPASQPLPVSKQQGRKSQGREPVAAPAQGNAPNGHSSQQPSREATPVTPSSQGATKDKANAQQDARAEQSPKAQHSPPAQQNPKPQQDVKPQQNTQAQRSEKVQPDPKAQQAAKSQQPAQPQQDAKTQQSAKAQQDAKAKADQKAKKDAKAKADQKTKKDQPEKADPDPEKGTSDQPN